MGVEGGSTFFPPIQPWEGNPQWTWPSLWEVRGERRAPSVKKKRSARQAVLSGGTNEATHYLLLLSTSRSRVLFPHSMNLSWPCSKQKNMVEGMSGDLQAVASKSLRSFSFDSQNPRSTDQDERPWGHRGPISSAFLAGCTGELRRYQQMTPAQAPSGPTEQ